MNIFLFASRRRISTFLRMVLIFSVGLFGCMTASAAPAQKHSTGRNVNAIITEREKDETEAITKGTTLDSHISQFFQARDLRHIRNLKKNYSNPQDQKIAYLELRKTLIQRQKSLTATKENKIITTYYSGLIHEIDLQVEDIDITLEAQSSKTMLGKIFSLFE